MAYSPVAFIAPNYRDYKTYWFKAYIPSTTTPKTIATDIAGATEVAKLQLNADGFFVSAGGAIVMPYIDGSYDAYLFRTEALADANDTTGAVRVADDISSLSALGVFYFDNIADMRLQTLPLGFRAHCDRYREDGPLIDGLDYFGESGTGDNLINHTMSGGSIVANLIITESLSIEQAGADPTNTLDSSPNINAAITYYPKVVAGGGVFKCLSDINLVSRHSLKGCPSTEFRIASESINLFNLLSCLYFVLDSINIVFDSDNSTAFKLHSDGGTATQLNKFYNINIEGNNRVGTVSVLFESVSFTNQFYSCNFFRTADGIVFGETGVSSNSVNANHFYGCEVRSDNGNANSNKPIIHRGGDNNGFIGGVIENWAGTITVAGGSFFLSKVYLEAFATGYACELNGGKLRLDGCFRDNSVFINDGEELSIIDPDLMSTSAWTINYPMIQYRADVNTRLTLITNANIDDVGFIHRSGQWRNPSAVWADRTLVDERVSWMPSLFNIRAAADKNNVTGSNEVYTIDFDNNKEFDYNAETDNNGIFTAKQCGIWDLKANITLNGLGGGDSVLSWIETSSRKYYISRQEVSADILSSAQFTFTGGCLARLNVGDTAVVKVQVNKSTPATTVDVIRGNAVDDFTSFSGSIIRG